LAWTYGYHCFSRQQMICAPFGSLIGATSKKYQDALGGAQTYATEALGSMRTVQSFTAEQREEQRYRSKVGDPRQHRFWFAGGAAYTTYKYGVNMALYNAGFFTIIFGVGFGAMYITLWYGFRLVNDGEITLGELTAFQSYIFQIGGALAQTSQFITMLIQAQGAAARIFYLLERDPLIATTKVTALPGLSALSGSKGATYDEEAQKIRLPVPPAPMVGAVDFNNVSFSYPSRPGANVLRNFSLSIPINTTAALVGSSGSGKTTVVSLLQRFYEVTEGSITIDGKDIRELDLKWMRSHIAYVQQEPQLFGLTVKENIAYGVDREVTQEEIEAAARDANAHDFVMAWPDGYNTLVGERGVNVSGGQRQRLAIARALLLAPRILLLDEATSALDSESEYLVQEAINRAVVGRTVLIVAHRLSTIQRAEKIVVLDNHAIVDIGTHQELLDRCPWYQDLIKRQSLVSTS
jgi:ABC-type multidrug transport system fused ATPase/permease subunit